MAVKLKPVDKNNFDACIKLEVKEEQSGFVTTNLFSIAQSKVYPECIPMVIYKDETLVGFTMFAFEEGKYLIARLMIDKNHQGNGYGKAAMIEGIKFLKKEFNCTEIYTSFEPENTVADKLYTSLGFIKTGEIIGGEVAMKLIVDMNDTYA